MKTLYLPVIIAALAAAPVQADDEIPESTAIAGQNATQRLWRDFEDQPSSLVSQLNAVYRILEAELADDLRQVAMDTVQAQIADEAQPSRDDNCRFMPLPGSRIRAERCYYPSEGELALNQYQFQEEIRQIRQQQQIQAMQEVYRQEEAERALQRQQAISGAFR